ncbi:CHAT domain-containing protein [Streptomyces sp. TLI_146]|nr:CHAT domain-containing protein [Streptomyces sp. TLI_146]
MVTGLVVDATGFELVVGDQRVGPRRMLQTSDVNLLNAVAGQYVDAVRNGSRDRALLAVGRELYRWLDGDLGQLTRLLDEASAPLVFEVRAPTKPSAAAWALLRAPYELLAGPEGGFLAEALKLFAVARRLGHPAVQAQAQAQPLDGYRLGVAVMASAPRGQHELDFEAEEMAILNAVGETGLDLFVEDSGNPEHLGLRLSELGGMPVVHLSCHGLHNWSPGPDSPATPVLPMEDDLGGACPTSADELVGLLTPRPRLAFVSACLTATGPDVTAGMVPPALATVVVRQPSPACRWRTRWPPGWWPPGFPRSWAGTARSATGPPPVSPNACTGSSAAGSRWPRQSPTPAAICRPVPMSASAPNGTLRGCGWGRLVAARWSREPSNGRWCPRTM